MWSPVPVSGPKGRFLANTLATVDDLSTSVASSRTSRAALCSLPGRAASFFVSLIGAREGGRHGADAAEIAVSGARLRSPAVIAERRVGQGGLTGRRPTAPRGRTGGVSGAAGQGRRRCKTSQDKRADGGCVGRVV